MSFRAAVLVVTLFAASVATAQSTVPAGLWEATVTVAGFDAPFRFEIDERDGRPTGAFFNGADRVESTGGRLDGNHLVLTFAQYGSTVDVTVAGDTLEGRYDRGTRGAAYPFKATRAVNRPASAEAPAIAGTWKIATNRAKEPAWRLMVQQQGGDVTATILRVDGDTGVLTGGYREGRFVLGHFSGARPGRIELTPRADGTLDVFEDGKTHYEALRVTDARAAALDYADPSTYVKVLDPAKPLVLEFPDLDGNLVSLADARFRNKVVVLSITGSWCPNCHDEAPFLADLYRRYRAQGLEIVMLAFEEKAQLAKPDRLRAFLAQYAITYPVLVAGEPAQLPEKVPGFENLAAFPTTIYLGRDGRVKATHTGFPGTASGELFDEAKAHVTSLVERLLAEKPPAAPRATASVAPAAPKASATTAPAGAKPTAGPKPTTRTTASTTLAQTAGGNASRKPSQLSLATSVRRTASGAELVLDITPKPGLHVYAPGAAGYTPVAFALDARAAATASATRYPAPEQYLFKPTSETLPVYERPFQLVIPVRFAAAAPAVLSGTLSFQACDARLCYRPDSVPVTFTLR